VKTSNLTCGAYVVNILSRNGGIGKSSMYKLS
jgi:hypothetical protein